MVIDHRKNLYHFGLILVCFVTVEETANIFRGM
jgi:hypothetical protein